MALVAMTTHDTVDYVSDLDPAKTKENGKDVIAEGATVFKLKPLDVFLMGHIYDNASVLRGAPGSQEVGIHTRVNQTNIETVRHGLAGLDNFADAKGNAIIFKTQKASVNGRPYDVVEDRIMNMLGVRLVAELADKVKSISEVTKAEEKN
jgi:hypothetical protein